MKVPPLRDRSGDVPLLIRHFLGSASTASDRGETQISEEALERLSGHSWPGNVRELENLMERLAILCGEEGIGFDDLPDEIGQNAQGARSEQELPPEGLSLNRAVEELERSLISQALDRTEWNKNQAAQLLDLNRTTLIEKIKKRELAPPG